MTLVSKVNLFSKFLGGGIFETGAAYLASPSQRHSIVQYVSAVFYLDNAQTEMQCRSPCTSCRVGHHRLRRSYFREHTSEKLLLGLSFCQLTNKLSWLGYAKSLDNLALTGHSGQPMMAERQCQRMGWWQVRWRLRSWGGGEGSGRVGQ
jgi:hypothetical protein